MRLVFSPGRLGLCAVLALVLSFSSVVFSAEPTNRPEKIFHEVWEGKRTFEEGKQACLDLMNKGANLPDRLEAAVKYVQLCNYAAHKHSATTRKEERRWEREEHLVAIKAALPLLEGLDEAHQKSLPALSLDVDLTMMIGFMIRDPERPREMDGLTTMPLVLLTRVLDADEKGLVPPDKVLAEDEDLELEKQWAKGQLDLLKDKASRMVVPECRSVNRAEDFGGIGERTKLTELMKKYPDNRLLQAECAERLNFLQKMELNNLRVEIGNAPVREEEK